MIFELPYYQKTDHVLFLDQSSTRLGFADVSSGKMVVGSYKLIGKTVFDRIDNFIQLVDELIDLVEPSILFYEDGTTMGFLKSKSQKMVANTLVFQIERACFTRRIEADTIHNQTLKTNIIQLSNELHHTQFKNDKSKIPVRQSVLQLLYLPEDFDIDEDAIDAAAMAILYANERHRSKSSAKRKGKTKNERKTSK